MGNREEQDKRYLAIMFLAMKMAEDISNLTEGIEEGLELVPVTTTQTVHLTHEQAQEMLNDKIEFLEALLADAASREIASHENGDYGQKVAFQRAYGGLKKQFDLEASNQRSIH